MLSEILKSKGASILSKKQQRHVVGGHNGGECHVFWRPYGPGTEGFWISAGTTVSTAQNLYNTNSHITGYCCASCDHGVE